MTVPSFFASRANSHANGAKSCRNTRATNKAKENPYSASEKRTLRLLSLPHNTGAGLSLSCLKHQHSKNKHRSRRHGLHLTHTNMGHSPYLTGNAKTSPNESRRCCCGSLDGSCCDLQSERSSRCCSSYHHASRGLSFVCLLHQLRKQNTSAQTSRISLRNVT